MENSYTAKKNINTVKGKYPSENFEGVEGYFKNYNNVVRVSYKFWGEKISKNANKKIIEKAEYQGKEEIKNIIFGNFEVIIDRMIK